MLTEEKFVIEENIEDKMSLKNSNGLISSSGENSINENHNESLSKKNINIEKQNIINDSLQLYANLDAQKENNYLDSEEVFKNLKMEIEKIKKRNELFSSTKESKSKKNIKAKIYNNFKLDESNNKNINNDEQILSKEKLHMNELSKNQDDNNNEENINDEILSFSLNDYRYFEYSYIDNRYEEESSFEDMNFDWNPLKEDFPYSYKKEENEENSYHFMELKNKALRVIQEIDYDERGLELNLNFNLIDKSELWIFTRSFVNKSINDSFYFDEKSENVDKNDYFNKYSSLIKIIRDINMNRCYVSFGAFYHEINENNKLYYKSFLKRQLIDYFYLDKNYNNSYYNNKSEFNLIIEDFGEENINTMIYFNNNKKSNDIKASFFLPLNKKAKILICGKGESVELKELKVKYFDKKKSLKNAIKFENENDVPKNCECCTIL